MNVHGPQSLAQTLEMLFLTCDIKLMGELCRILLFTLLFVVKTKCNIKFNKGSELLNVTKFPPTYPQCY